MSYNISVVIPTTRSIYLKELLESLKAQTYKNFEVIVVDNSINETESQKIKSISDSFEIKYVREEKDGLHNARNRGVLESKGGIIIFLDDDEIPDHNLIEELIKPFYIFDKVAVVGGKVIPICEGKLPDYMNHLKYSYTSRLDYGEKIMEVPTVAGGNMACLKDIYIRVGGGNPDAFQKRENIWYSGDGESGFCRKIIRSGWKIIYTPYAVVKHRIPSERLQINNLKKQAFKHGIQMSYSKFFGSSPSKFLLAVRSISFFLLFLHNMVLHKLHSYPVNIRYELDGETFKARFLYELRLIFNKKLREHIRRTNWIT